ncbi:MAG TPA: DUF4268 domain-containing protein [Candidatus Elarobacter sp.]|jgi:hypothetical protein|nr:DUF4268 domain-containing protein [Candidatus Elarobacter sp.]
MMRELGTLRVVNIRDVWPLEPQHFSRWVADNIGILGDAIGMTLELERTEADVGAFSVDIVARDINRDRMVIIENQLTRTDHDHLGKLLTYTAGLKANVIIWISPEFREEHRAAIDWLNENTDSTKEFFAIQIEALQIDESRPAPNFRLLSFPNGWQKNTSAAAQHADETARQHFFLRYFGELGARAREAGLLKAQRSSGQADLVLDRLSAGAYIAIAFSRNQLNAGVYIARNDASENRRILESLMHDREAIEAEIGAPLNWDLSDGRVRQQVWTSTSVDRQDEAQLDASRTWAIGISKQLKAAFEPRLTAIYADSTRRAIGALDQTSSQA